MWNDPLTIEWATLLIDSFQHWTGEDLIVRVNPSTDAHKLFTLVIEVVSHGIGPVPILNYGNRAALRLWKTDWTQFTQLPSRMTAEPPDQAERERMLDEVSRNGFIRGYHGVRITAQGRRFQIQDATVWNVLDRGGQKVGQAAMLNNWKFL